jgi:hypothetical protein
MNSENSNNFLQALPPERPMPLRERLAPGREGPLADVAIS